MSSATSGRAPAGEVPGAPGGGGPEGRAAALARHAAECTGEDHRLESYAASDRRLLGLVEDFNRRLVAAAQRGVDLTSVLAALDPDPARYTGVDEAEGAVEAALEGAEAALASAPPLAGFRLLSSKAVASGLPQARPAVALGPDGSMLAAWIEWEEGAGEQVMAVLLDAAGEQLGEPRAVSGARADCLRPSAIFDGDGNAWVLFGARRGGEVAVFSSMLAPSSGGPWSEPEPISTTPHPSFNQEVARHSDGSLECCWQGYSSGRFQIFSRRQGGAGAFGETLLLSGEGERNVWDPAIAADAGGGACYAWTSYGEGGYRTALLSRPRGPAGEVRRLVGLPGAYSLHPSLAIAGDGSLWCAYDSVALGGHGGSGPTRLRERLGPAQERGTRPDGRAVPGDLAPEVDAEVVVVRLADPAGEIEETGPVGSGCLVSPAGLPRLATLEGAGRREGGSEVAVAYRCLRRLPLMLYFWETVVEWHGPSGWGGLTAFDHADGPLEEPALAAGSSGAVAAWQQDGRRERELSWTEGFGGEECIRLREHYGEVVWHTLHTGGRIRTARLEAPGLTGAAAGGAPPRPRPKREARPWAAARRGGPPPERFASSVDGVACSLYWGDLHRHSLISRCTAGDEPELDDFYRYSFDVCEYDFWAVTDHAENTSSYQWAQIQKLADILHVAGRFVPFYGFEWTAATGHQNVIYESSARGAPIYSSTAAETSTPDRLWAHLRTAGQRCITIPHHPGSAMVPFDWSYHDEELLRLVEVFQACRGNYEEEGCFRQYSDGTLSGTFVADGLRQGHRFGFIASSDHGNGASYVGAFAPELSRESIFEALRARRTIGATTRDIALDFRLNGAFMGSEVPVPAGAALSCRVQAYGEIARIDIVRDGEVVHRVEPPLELPPGWLFLPVRVEWATGEVPRTDWSGHLEMEGGELLQTRYWSPEIVDVRAGGASWVAETRNFHSQYGAQRGGVELTLMGPPAATVRVSTAELGGSTTLAELSSAGRVEMGRNEHGSLCVMRGTGGLRSTGSSELTTRFEDEPSPGSWYYARVTLEDGEMAWSSPIWAVGR